MALFEEIRREYEHGVGTITGVAKKLGVHRRMVREALGSAVPRERKIAVRERPKLGPAKSYIDTILETDRKAPRKQRHTAHRIWRRLSDEMAELQVSESTVRKYVRERKLELGLLGRETFIPQSYKFGEEAQVDWYEAYAELDGEREKTPYFLHAKHGQWRGFSPCLSACKPASFSGSPRDCLPLLWWGFRHRAV